jgi:PhnB protein
MKHIDPYLTFSGNCRQAMTFYKNCLGGELKIQSVGESPLSAKMPAPMKEAVLHASLENKKIRLMGTDCVSEYGLIKGNSVSLCLHCDTKDEIHSLYEKLSEGGKKTFQIEETLWGTLFGGLTDQFGTHWLLNYQKK